MFCNRYCCAGESLLRDCLLACEVEVLSLHSAHPVLPDQCRGLAEASDSICPSLLNHFESVFPFPAFLVVGRQEEMVIFAEVICPL